MRRTMCTYLRRGLGTASAVRFCAAIVALAVAGVATAAYGQGPTTLARLRTAGGLTCGVDTEQPEYSLDDAHGNHVAFDTDICRAVAVAALGKQARLIIKPYRDEADSLKALARGEIDLLATASDNVQTDGGRYALGPIILYDQQGFLVRRDGGIRDTAGLAGKKICFLLGTEIEAQLTSYMLSRGIEFIPAPFSEEGEMEAALVTHNCDAVSADVTQLAYERAGFKGMTQAFTILPDVVAKDPLAPAVRTGDPQWEAIVRWVMYALMQAEENGISRDNLAGRRASGGGVEARRLLGTQPGYGQYLGLDDAWAARAIEAVGNYGEMFERDLGTGSALQLERGANQLPGQGGLLYAPPLR